MSFASIEHVPHYLIDNASVLGALSVITALLFLIDLGAPRAKKANKTPTKLSKATQSPTLPQYTQEMEKPAVKKTIGRQEEKKVRLENGYKKMKEKHQAKGRFDIYGKDAEDFETESEVSMEKHSPVWSNVRKGRYEKKICKKLVFQINLKLVS